MSSIVILYEGDHEERAQELNNSLVNSSEKLPVEAPARTVVGLKTLILWGHGDEYVLCGKNDREIFELIKAWRKLNPYLRTVEILTCNSAHWRPQSKTSTTKPKEYFLSQLAHLGKGKVVNNSFNKQVKRRLKYSFSGDLRQIKVRGMPFSDLSGHRGSVSILLWDKDTCTWALVPGKCMTGYGSDQQMNWKKQMLIIDMKPRPFVVDEPWEWFSGDNLAGPLTDRLDRAKRLLAECRQNKKYAKSSGARPQDGEEFSKMDFGDCLAGHVQHLCDALVEIH